MNLFGIAVVAFLALSTYAFANVSNNRTAQMWYYNKPIYGNPNVAKIQTPEQLRAKMPKIIQSPVYKEWCGDEICKNLFKLLRNYPSFALQHSNELGLCYYSFGRESNCKTKFTILVKKLTDYSRVFEDEVYAMVIIEQEDFCRVETWTKRENTSASAPTSTKSTNVQPCGRYKSKFWFWVGLVPFVMLLVTALATLARLVFCKWNVVKIMQVKAKVPGTKNDAPISKA